MGQACKARPCFLILSHFVVFVHGFFLFNIHSALVQEGQGEKILLDSFRNHQTLCRFWLHLSWEFIPFVVFCWYFPHI